MNNEQIQALKEQAECVCGVLENIAGYEPDDIDGDDVELRFETEDGFDTGCTVSIVEQCQSAADVIRSLLAERDADKALIAELKHDVDAANARVDAGCAQLCNQDDLIATLRDACSQWERKAISNFEECAEMSARIEELESQRKLAFTASNRWADKFRDAEKRIAELEGALNLASASYAGERERADALQARTLTVKLPGLIGPEAAPAHYWDNGESMAYADGYNKAISDAKELYAVSAGITLVVGGVKDA